MDFEEFKKILDKIQRYYGKEYNDVQINEIYKYFGKMSLARFNYIVSKLYQKNKYLPILADFVEVHKENPYTDFNKNKEKKKNECKICNGLGFVLYKKYIAEMDMTYECVAYCECSTEYQFDGAKCKNDKNKSKYYIKSYKEVFGGLNENL